MEAEGQFKMVPLDPRVLDKTVCIGAEASEEEKAKVLDFLDKRATYLHGLPAIQWELVEIS
jgi:hypothetical protein